jgi:SAM-dependent methyltransferase
VDRTPEDADARRDRLLAWAAEQQQRIDDSVPDPPKRTHAVKRAAYVLMDRSTRVADRLLDRRLNTSSPARLPEHEHADRLHYVATPWHVLPRALRHVHASADDTFVDFGCGKGRVVHQAARWPLRRVIGVEVSAALADQARATVAAHAHQHQCGDVEIVVCDAAEYRVPDDMTIGFLFHPFGGETFDAVLQAIIDSTDRRPRRVRLIYVLPHGRARILATGRFRLINEMHSGLYGIRVAIFESVPTTTLP